MVYKYLSAKKQIISSDITINEERKLESHFKFEKVVNLLGYSY